jgi:hypothetical protein
MSLPCPSAVVDLSLVNMGRKTTVSTVLTAVLLNASSLSFHQVDKLLADIPALSVGLLGFATLTFFMILKKVKLSVFPPSPYESTLSLFLRFRSGPPFLFSSLLSSPFLRQ